MSKVDGTETMLNTDRFSKVYNAWISIPHGSDNAHERAAARRKAEEMAQAAGMTLDQAVAQLAQPPSGSSGSFFEEVFNTPEFRARRAEREREQRQKRHEAMKKYGSEEAVFQDTELEKALREACSPLIVRDTETFWTLAGWTGGKPSMPAEVLRAVTLDCPLPDTVAKAWDEYNEHDARYRERCYFCESYDREYWVEARMYALEDLLDHLPARSTKDFRARLSWMDFCNKAEFTIPPEEDAVRLATLRADFERLALKLRDALPQDSSSIEPIKIRRSNLDKRQAVLNILTTPKGNAMTLREIAERAGVHHQTVANIKRELERTSNFDTRQTY